MQVEDIFNDMSLVPLLAPDAESKEWMSRRPADDTGFPIFGTSSFGGAHLVEIFGCNERGKKLASIYDNRMDLFRSDSHQEHVKTWGETSHLEKALVLNKIADALEKNVEMLSVLESLSTGRVVHRVRNDVLPYCIRHFRYFRSILLRREEQPVANRLRVFLCLPASASLSVAVRKLVPALCLGDNVDLFLYGSRSEESDRTANLALYFLEELMSGFSVLKDVIKIFYSTKPFSDDLLLRLESVVQTAEKGGGHLFSFVGTEQEARLIGKKIPFFSASCAHRTCVVVFDSCDVDCAVEAVVRALSGAAEQSLDFRVLVQETIFSTVIQRLVVRLECLRIGVSLDETADLGPLNIAVKDYIKHLKEAKEPGVNEVRCEGFDIITFRNANEAIELVDDSIRDVRASIWTEDVDVALEVSENVSASTVWVNCVDVYDAAVPVAYLKRSGNCVDGGEWGIEQLRNFLYFPSESTSSDPQLVGIASVRSKSESKAWASASALERSEVLLSGLGELSRQMEELCELESRFHKEDSKVRSFIRDLGFWASKCCAVDTVVQNLRFNGRVVVIHVPIGSILVTLGSLHPLKLFVNFALSAVAFGNTTTVVVDGSHAAFFQRVLNMLTSRGLPPGVLTVHSSEDFRSPPDDFDAHFVLECDGFLQNFANDVKFPIVVNYDNADFWLEVDGICNERLQPLIVSNCTRPKTVWLSSGSSLIP